MAQGVPEGLSVSLDVNDVSDVPGTDRAAIAQGSASFGGHTINASAIYFLKGATFVTYSDLLADQPAPTADALEAEAQVVLGRLP